MIARQGLVHAMCVLLVLGMAGCGGSDERKDREEVERVLTDYVRAVHTGDPGRACPLFTSAYVRENLRENRQLKLERGTCEELVAALEAVFKQLTPNPAPRVTEIKVSGDKATARMEIKTALGPAASRFFIVRQGEDWKIDHDEDLREGPDPAPGV